MREAAYKKRENRIHKISEKLPLKVGHSLRKRKAALKTAFSNVRGIRQKL